jgi:hypothetical protein
MKLKYMFLLALLIPIGVKATERVVSLYKTHKLAPNTVMITCNDGTEPSIQHSLSFVIITCKVEK